MKVILLQELKGRGGEGDVVEVAKGFANNFLFPKKIAVEATKGNLKQLEMRKHNIAKREASRLDDAEKVKAVLEGVVVKIVAKVGEEGQLFGSVTSQMISEGLLEAAGLEVDKKRIDLKAPIKTAGEHEVFISLYRDIKTSVKIFVGDENAEPPSEEAAAEETAAKAAVAKEAVAETEVAEPAETAEGIVADAAAEAAASVEAAMEEVISTAKEALEAEAVEVSEAVSEAQEAAVEAVEAVAEDAETKE